MKFGESIEYKMRNILLEKSYTKSGGKTSPRPLSKKSKSTDQISFSDCLHSLRYLALCGL